MEYKVAPSFEKYERKSEPFLENGKMYVQIEHPNTHNIRKVRAYTAAEFAKAYGGKKLDIKPQTDDEYLAGLKIARGFEFGPIELLESKDEGYFSRNPNIWYCVEYGWYLPSTHGFLDGGFNEDLPKDLKRKLLTWNEFLEKYWKGRK